MEASRPTASRSEQPVKVGEFRAALEDALRLAAEDDRIGPMLSATHLRMRFRFTDADLVLNVATDDDDRWLRWSFDEVDWTPKLELLMDSRVANRYLQGKESLAIAIARGQARFRGESRTALLYLPAARLLCEPYRKVVTSEYPQLAIA